MFDLLKVLYYPVHNLEIITVSFSPRREIRQHHNPSSKRYPVSWEFRQHYTLWRMDYDLFISPENDASRHFIGALFQGPRVLYAQADRLRSFHIAREWRLSLPHLISAARPEFKTRKPTRKPFSVYRLSSRGRDRRGCTGTLFPRVILSAWALHARTHARHTRARV